MKTKEGHNGGFEGLLSYLKRTRGFDFLAYKRNSLMRRARKRTEAVRIDSFEEYVDYLEVHPEEFAQLFNTMLINVTSFFRDPQTWDYLRDEIIPKMLEEKGPNDTIRVWSAGCASGEEAYSLAILLCEALGPEQFQKRAKIYASDVDDEALAQARAASYTLAQLDPLSEAMRIKYFVPHGDRFVFRNDLRRSVIFGRHDLVQDAPISRLDLLVCRNTLMYLNAETQVRILARFHFALNDTGYLFLGKAEMLLTHSSLFTPVEVKCRVFRKMPKVSYRDRLLVMAQAGDTEAVNHLGRHVRLRESAFETERTARLIVDMNGVVTLANARMRMDFGIEPTDIGRPLQDIQISYRPVELRSLMDRARSERKTVSVPKVERRADEGTSRFYDVEVFVLTTNGDTPVGFSISFLDVTRSTQLQQDLERSNQELETANEELQSAHEELETTNEELQSTNEELETTNEELQSTNEELETMNEELQSTNEELETINTELRQRTEDLDRTNLFLQSILKSLRAGVVVLDTDLNVLIWNYMVEDLWGLRSDEVRGKPFLNLDIGLPVEQLRGAVRDALSGLATEQDLYVDALTRRGRTIECRVSCTPLRPPDNGAIRGVVLVMLDRGTLGWPEVLRPKKANARKKNSRRAARSR